MKTRRMQYLHLQSKLYDSYCVVCPNHNNHSSKVCNQCPVGIKQEEIGELLLKDTAARSKRVSIPEHGHINRTLDELLLPNKYFELLSEGLTHKEMLARIGFNVPMSTFGGWKKSRGLNVKRDKK